MVLEEWFYRNSLPGERRFCIICQLREFQVITIDLIIHLIHEFAQLTYLFLSEKLFSTIERFHISTKNFICIISIHVMRLEVQIIDKGIDTFDDYLFFG